MPNDRRDTVLAGRHSNRRPRSAAVRQQTAAIVAEYAALPDSLRDSATAEAPQEIIDLDLDSLADIRPPRGFGRDRVRMKWGISR